jgi:mannose-6-phosphate isomerase-like protein (cupin superfamily)
MTSREIAFRHHAGLLGEAYRESEAACANFLRHSYAPPYEPSPPLHIHRVTDEAFYVLEGTFGFQADEETIEGSAGAFVFIARGRKHTFWNQGSVPARVLIVLSPSGFERYFEALAEGLAVVGERPEEAMSLRKALSQRYDIEVVGPPRQAQENPL